MKKRSGRNLIRFFYHLLVVLVMAMPMLSGLVRVIYVQSNKNAKDSYYGDTINVSQFQYVDFLELSSGNTYIFKNEFINNVDLPINRYTYFYVSNVIDNSIDTSIDYSTITRFALFLNSSNIPCIDFYTDNGFLAFRTLNSYLLNFTFSLLSVSSYTNNTWINDFNIFGYIYFVDYSYLDNVFDYSMWKTMHEFTFHSDFSFTDIANGMLMTFDNNNLYIQYINFYINWLLTTAVISFAPYVLLTFYHLAIGLLDKFMKKGEDL